MQKFVLLCILWIISTSYASGFTGLNNDLISYIQIADTIRLIEDTQDSLDVLDSIPPTDSLLVTVRVDTLAPIYTIPLSNKSNFIDAEQMSFLNYRNIYELLENIPGGTTQKLGFILMPENFTLNGFGFNSTNYLLDGIPVNNRISNTLNLNLLQFESSELIESVQPVKGFLYGLTPNLNTISFTVKDFVPGAPYSRVKYFEGPVGEAFLDFQFNTIAFKRFTVFIDVTNKKVDESFLNTSATIWQAQLKVKYLFNNNINLTAGYIYSQYEAGLNGGINFDSVKILSENVFSNRSVDDIFYDQRSAPVLFPNQYEKQNNGTLYFRSSLRVLEDNLLEITGYRFSGLNEFRNNEDSAVTSQNRIFNNAEDITLGLTAKLNLKYKFTNLKLFGGYEENSFNFTTPFSNSNREYSNYSAGGELTLNPIELIELSVFTKVFQSFNNFYPGSGFLASLKLPGNIKLYGGYSFFESPVAPLLGGRRQNNVLQASASGKIENLSASVDILFISRDDQTENFQTVQPAVVLPNSRLLSFREKENTIVDIKLNYQLNILNLGLRAYLPFNKIQGSTKESASKQFIFDIGYKSVLFDDNLELQLNLRFAYSSSTVYYEYNRFYNGIIYDASKPDIDNFYTLGFYAAGRIDKAATVFFSWENLLDQKYYATPYYPGLTRNIRFGIAWEFLN